MKIRNRQTTGTITALAGGICWGFPGCCGQSLFKQKAVQVPWLVTMCLLFTGILLVLTGFELNGRENLSIFRKRQDAFHPLAFAIFGITFYQYTYFMAIQTFNAGIATMLQYLLLVLILLVVYTRGKCLPKGLELGAIGLSLLGTFVTGTHGNIHTFHISGEALFWDLLAAVSSMICTMVLGGLILKYDIYQALEFGIFMGDIAMEIFVRPWTCTSVWGTGTVGVLADVVVVGIVLAFGLFLQGVSPIGPLRGSTMGGVEPVSAVIILVFWLNTFSILANLIEFALILGAVFVLISSQRPKSLKKADAGITDGT